MGNWADFETTVSTSGQKSLGLFTFGPFLALDYSIGFLDVTNKLFFTEILLKQMAFYW